VAKISIQREHTLSAKAAKTAANKVAEELASRFDIQYAWDGNVLNFERSGVKGQITVSKGNVSVDAELIGFAMSLLKSTVEGHVHSYLDKEFKA
jgi:putative polyhydroxyalkanoate system protein